MGRRFQAYAFFWCVLLFPHAVNILTLMSQDAPGMFLLNSALWRQLGTRVVWVSFRIGFERGKWHRRRARTVESLPIYGEQNADRVNLLWTDHKGQIKRDIVPIEYLDPAAPTAQGREGIILTGLNFGKLVKVHKYLRKAKRLQVAIDGDTASGRPEEAWEELEDNICWVEQVQET
jgi:hypothetical protein